MNENKKNHRKDWREARRLQAWKLWQKGWKQKDIAEALDVSEGAVSQWLKKAREEGIEGLQHRKGGGPKPRLSDTQIEKLPELLQKGAEAYGFRGNVWTRSRVAKVIKRIFDVEFSVSHVGRLLERIGWTQQKPKERATQRNEQAIEHWRTKKWDELQKKPNVKNEP